MKFDIFSILFMFLALQKKICLLLITNNLRPNTLKIQTVMRNITAETDFYSDTDLQYG